MICSPSSSEPKLLSEAQLNQIAREYHQLPRTALEQRLGRPLLAPPGGQLEWSVYAPKGLGVFVRYSARGKPELVFVSSGIDYEAHLGQWPPLKTSRRGRAGITVARN